MPIRSRCSAACALVGALAWLGLSAAQAQQAAGSWTDPPTRNPAAASDASRPAPKALPAPEAQAPSVETVRGKDAGDAAAARRRSASRTPRRIVRRAAPEPRRAVVRAAPRRRVAATGPNRTRGFVSAERWPAQGLPVGVAAPPSYDASDPRLERLQSAEEAGYIVIRRRTVEFPDGRTLRVYRPRGAFDDPD